MVRAWANYKNLVDGLVATDLHCRRCAEEKSLPEAGAELRDGFELGLRLDSLADDRRGMALSLPHYLLDAAVCLAFGLLSFRVTRVRQMVTRYNWINVRTGRLGWRRRA